MIRRIGLRNNTKPSATDKIYFHIVPSIIYAAPLSIGAGTGIDAANAAMLQDALQSPNVIPGDTILLLDGLYYALYIVTVTGTAANRIVIKPVNCYQAIIDGGIIIGNYTGNIGRYVNIENMRIYNSDLNRGTWLTPQGTITRQTSVSIAAYDCNLINNIIHDGGVGITAYVFATSANIYGNIVFNSGWADDNQGGAQNIYVHSLNKTIKHNIFAGAFKRTVAIYTTNETINNIVLEENVIFERIGTLIGGVHGETIAASFVGNNVIQRGLQCGYTYNDNNSIIVRDNIIYAENGAGYFFGYFKNIEAINNKIIAGSPPISGYQGQAITIVMPSVIGLWNFNNNTYYYTGITPLIFVNIEGVSSYSFINWQGLGHDVASAYNTGLPLINDILIYPNDYATTNCRKGFIVIWNWEGLNTVSVDLSSLGLVNGSTYRWRQAQDPLTDTNTFVYAGVNVNFDMTGHTVALPIGFAEELIPSKFPLFGCFIIESV